MNLIAVNKTQNLAFVNDSTWSFLIEQKAITSLLHLEKTVYVILNHPKYGKKLSFARKCSELPENISAFVPKELFFRECGPYRLIIEPCGYQTLSCICVTVSSALALRAIEQNPGLLASTLLEKHVINIEDVIKVDMVGTVTVASLFPERFGIFTDSTELQVSLKTSSNINSTIDIVNFDMECISKLPVATKCVYSWRSHPYFYQKFRFWNAALEQHLNKAVTKWIEAKASSAHPFVLNVNTVESFTVPESLLRVLMQSLTNIETVPLESYTGANSEREIEFQCKFCCIYKNELALDRARISLDTTSFERSNDFTARRDTQQTHSQQLHIPAVEFSKLVFPTDGPQFEEITKLKTALNAPLALKILLYGPVQSGKTVLVQHLAAQLGLDILDIEAADALYSYAPANPALWLQEQASRATKTSILLLRHVSKLGSSDAETYWFSDALKDFQGILVATTNDKSRLPPALLAQFEIHIAWTLPTRSTIETFIQRFANQRASCRETAKSLVSFSWTSLWRMVQAADGLETAVRREKGLQRDKFGALKIPQVKWTDVGGLARVKQVITESMTEPSAHSSRHGLLFYGPPGTGKTLAAKAIACEMGYFFISVKGPELLNMYIGESEANVRRIFERARSCLPCVIFFDEIDSIAPARGNAGDSRGVMDRLVSQLLSEMDSLEPGLFVIAATNRPDLVDDALLRPGRFDKMLYLGVPKDKDEQLQIVQAQTRKLALSKCDLRRVVELLPPVLTGADIYAFCAQVQSAALKRLIASERCSDKLQIEQQDFIDAIGNIKPSVSAKELFEYESLQAKYSL